MKQRKGVLRRRECEEMNRGKITGILLLFPDNVTISFYNESGTIAEANWTGYKGKGDWHNITFDKPVVLLANKT